MNKIATMTEPITLRAARRDEARTIAELFRICSGGVADYIWSKLAGPGESLIEVGARRYAREDTAFSYQNCVMAERDATVAGMMHAYPIVSAPAGEADGPVDPVLRPAAELEIPGSLYISGLAVFPEHRNLGLGTRFLERARERARDEGLTGLSALVFDANDGSLRLLRRHGFRAVDRRAVVPHQLLEYDGELLLLYAPL